MSRNPTGAFLRSLAYFAGQPMELRPEQPNAKTMGSKIMVGKIMILPSMILPESRIPQPLCVPLRLKFPVSVCSVLLSAKFFAGCADFRKRVAGKIMGGQNHDFASHDFASRSFCCSVAAVPRCVFRGSRITFAFVGVFRGPSDGASSPSAIHSVAPAHAPKSSTPASPSAAASVSPADPAPCSPPACHSNIVSTFFVPLRPA